jgi:alkylation response protein AidB-like acyl-CoA dehydrogenase
LPIHLAAAWQGAAVVGVLLQAAPDTATAVDGGLWQRSYFNAFAATIGGGPSQIQANIVGERVLGLPKD